MGALVPFHHGTGPRQWRIQDFPRRGSQPSFREPPGYNFIKISPKLHEIEKKLVVRGGCAPGGAP